MLSYNKDKQYMIEQDAKSIDAMVNQIVEDSTKELDEYIENVKRELDVAELSISEMNLILMKLCSYYFYLAKQQEMVGVRQDIATIYEKEKYNLHFMGAVGTVASKTSQAEEKTKEERVISLVWEKSYKILKNKYTALGAYIDALKKVITSKIKEMELSGRM
nr:MAG TPA: hypothetical protein [Caudoviricetes sp.]